jgi:hypothetical protein
MENVMLISIYCSERREGILALLESDNPYHRKYGNWYLDINLLYFLHYTVLFTEPRPSLTLVSFIFQQGDSQELEYVPLVLPHSLSIY